MRFALLGNHSDGVELVCALVATGRHQVVAYTSPIPSEVLARWGPGVQKVNDLEEVLADPAIEAIIVASRADSRPFHLRRALQSERHVLCVCPPDQTPETAYEAGMIQTDTRHVLMPILTEGLHPAIERLASFIRPGVEGVGSFRLLEVERAEMGPVLDNLDIPGHKPSFPGWDLLRRLGGEIAEVTAFAAGEEIAEGEPLLLAGRFAPGGLFRLTLLPSAPTTSWRLNVVGRKGRAELFLPHGMAGPALLDYRSDSGDRCEEAWERWDPWPAVIGLFEAALRKDEKGEQSSGSSSRLSWQDAVRSLELDDAARRSIEKRRTSLLEYQEASEEVGFKGTMTLVGCGLLWLVILVVILARWVPQIGYLIVPILAVFLVMQLLRYLIPREPDQKP